MSAVDDALLGLNSSQSDYELREARSEISRHHRLIVDLRDGLDWALAYISFACPDLSEADLDRFGEYTRLLNRQVG